MDRNELKLEINKFIDQCSAQNKPVSEYCLKEAYPGDSSTSYFFQLKANWIKNDECFDAISFFTDIMFEVMNFEARKKIFSIQVFKKNDVLQCDSGEIIHVKRKIGYPPPFFY